MLLVTAAQMRALDRHTIVVLGVPGAVLMESAGRGVLEVMAAHYTLAGASVVVFAGPGNNGGDGFVIARHLCNRGARVTLALGCPAEQIAGDARVHFEACRRLPVTLVEAAAVALTPGELVVDALLGTGLSRPLAPGPLRDAILRISTHAGPVVAVDVPSGLDADRGPTDACVVAERTVTFAFAKLGLFTPEARRYVGALHVVDIGIPDRLARAEGVQAELLEPSCVAPLRRRDPEGHKGTHGHVLVVAGAPGKEGAALLCGTAALRAGAGLCTVASGGESARLFAGRRPELMIESLGELGPLLAGKRAAAIGPGLGQSELAAEWLATLVAAELPLVLDADALGLIAARPERLGVRSAATILTPHPGEAARLLGEETAAVQRDRVGAARAIAGRFGALCVLKGARTVVAAPDGRLALNPTGNPGMGTAGTGDVLTGCVVAALARQVEGAALDPFLAATAAVYAHGAAGDRAAARRSQVGLLASDVIDALPEVLGRG